MKPRRAVLRYHGGKWLLAPWIISHFPRHRFYTEVYGGAASVLLQKPRCYGEVYNDLYKDVVVLFRILRDEQKSRRLQELVELTPFARNEFSMAGRRSSDSLEQARRFLVRSFMGYGSDSVFGRPTGFRGGVRKSGTTPAIDWQRFPESIPSITARLKGVTIESRPAIQLLQEHDGEDTLHYVDPPYVHSTRSNGNPHCKKHRYAFEMSDDDHRELAEVLKSLSGMVVLSGYPSDLYGELFADWKLSTKRAFADGAEERTECLWINQAAARQLQPSLWEVA
jgi:DNA adenine methylase